ncbi:phage baseplate assembly protein [Bordetella bronchiseptica]|uniref:phage baseplate assembly protein n=1 Tax=Bordetella bronchiseptica TaxID=518 RepID=UPI003994BF6B
MDGDQFHGWTEVKIGAGIERVARDFNLSITWKWPGSTERPVRIRQGARCEVRVGRDLVVTGYAYSTPIRYSATEVSCTVSGRSLTSDLVDCTVDDKPGQWRGQPMTSIVRDLAGSYGIKVVDESQDGVSVADHSVDPSETVFQSIDRLLSLSALFASDDGRGQLVMAKPGSKGRAVDPLELGKNIKTGGAALDFSRMYSEYRCIGQRAGTDEEFGAAAAEIDARVTDDRVGRRRALKVNPSGQLSPALAQRRAEWERDNRISRALTATYEVQGWRQSNGDLWLPNMVVRVVDDLIGFDRDMLIIEVAYVLGNEGRIVEMTVAPPEGFVPEPTHKKDRKRKKGGDAFEYLLPEDWEGDR